MCEYLCWYSNTHILIKNILFTNNDWQGNMNMDESECHKIFTNIQPAQMFHGLVNLPGALLIRFMFLSSQNVVWLPCFMQFRGPLRLELILADRNAFVILAKESP